MLPGDYFPLQIMNNSTFPDSQIYILGYGLSASGTTDQSWIQFNSSGSGTLVLPSSGSMQSSPYSVQLSMLPLNAGNTGYILYVPHTWSGRLHISLNHELALTAGSGNTISDPNPFDPTDPNYFVLWDKVEFTYGSGSININTTAVDFFGLPLTLQLDGSDTVVGLASRSEVLASISGHLTGPWENLVLNYSGVTTSGSGASVLRVMSPDEANGNTQPQQTPFPSGYLDPYISAVWNHYQSSHLDISVSGTTYTGTVDPSSNYFNFTGESAVSVSGQPTSNDVFGCNGVLLTSSGQTNAQNSINRVLGTALNLGLLPLAPGIPPLTSASWIPSAMPPYYTNNPQLPSALLNRGSAWYNAYAAAIHDNRADNQGALIYAFPYDDQAGQSSLLISNTAASATLTIGDCTGTKIPDLTAPTVWDVNFAAGFQASGSVTTNSGQVSFGYPGSVTVSGLSSGFEMTYNSTGSDVTYIVYIVTSEELGTVMSAYPYLGIVVASVDGSTISAQLPGQPTT